MFYFVPLLLLFFFVFPLTQHTSKKLYTVEVGRNIENSKFVNEKPQSSYNR